MEPTEIHVRVSEQCPDGWTVFCDDEDKTIAIVMLNPTYRCIYGNPLDENITALKISMAQMARHAAATLRQAALEMWVPPGKPS